MKGWFGSGKSKTRRVSLDLHYDVRPSVWRRLVERSHLIVAGIGSIAMLGLAGTAIWLALPSDAADQIVARVEAAPSVAAESATAATAPNTETDAPAETVSTEIAARVQPAAEARPAAAAKPEPVEAAAPDAAAATAMDVEPLDPTDPRWIAATSGHAAAGAAKTARVEASAEEGETADKTAPPTIATAYATDDEGGADEAATAAIPIATPAPDVTGQAEQQAEKKTASVGRPGKTVRSVTMRAKPDDRGGVLGTVPGRVDVQVVSCASWCEIIYKGKRGFVFRKFLRNNGR
ncbi:SH3 domain-containing protein [Mesorhizobium sp. LHD-90]|uniref:SH3 domain-containing protein n=1 Tax=Mesorhizobium sp. LHD-90 TaxID=3071414 RepID=UPI0027DF77D4|nr:SH3 domain-containing protein [Mesorhizobium sp. LHD-90]MDQ6436682.1 SH3 domain-containing protein [Mesorhizobium sp. LHD-90]